jgi:predicted enzyme related to lactoylglutathione lyase
MERVRGLGGVFVRSKDKEALSAWYRDHLGVELASWGGVEFLWGADGSDGLKASTTFSLFAPDTEYFGSPDQTCMLNFRVSDLDAMLAQLRALGDEVIDTQEDSEYGRFAWVIDPEGRRVELWQPPRAEAESPAV